MKTALTKQNKCFNIISIRTDVQERIFRQVYENRVYWRSSRTKFQNKVLT